MSEPDQAYIWPGAQQVAHRVRPRLGGVVRSSLWLPSLRLSPSGLDHTWTVRSGHSFLNLASEAVIGFFLICLELCRPTFCHSPREISNNQLLFLLVHRLYASSPRRTSKPAACCSQRTLPQAGPNQFCTMRWAWGSLHRACGCLCCIKFAFPYRWFHACWSRFLVRKYIVNLVVWIVHPYFWVRRCFHFFLSVFRH